MSLRFRAALFTAVLGSGALSFVGCGADFDHTDLSNVRPGPLGGNVNYSRVDVVEGALIVAHIANIDDDKDEMKTEFRIQKPQIVDVQGVVSDGDYAFFGLQQGESDVEIRANGKLVLILKVYVSKQPPLP